MANANIIKFSRTIHYLTYATTGHCNKLQLTIHTEIGVGLSKLQGKGVTHSQKVEWWRTFMVECVTLFSEFSLLKEFKSINHQVFH